MRESVIAFIDIMGFSEGVEKNKSDELLKILEHLSLFSSNAFEEKVDFDKGELFKLNPAISTFSDSIIISFPIDTNIPSGIGHALALTLIANTISYFFHYCLVQGYLLRGAISSGLLIHENGIVIGSPYIEAVNSEKSIAVFPRIIICSTLLNMLPNSEITRQLSRDRDGIYFLDWWKVLIFRYCIGDKRVTELEEVISRIEGEVKITISNQKYFSKWCWMANYINNCTSICKNNFTDFSKKINLKSIEIPLK